MAHLLATMNPAAADAIDHPPAPPDVSTWVVFLPRAGVTRMHRSEFPAMVMGSYDDGTLSLLVVMEAEDMISEERVPFQSHNQSAYCWRHRRAGPGEADLEPRIKEVEDFLRGEDKLGDVVDAIGARLENVERTLREEREGDAVAIDGKLNAVVNGLHQRLEAVEQVLASDEMEALEKRIAALEGKKKPGRKPKSKG